MIHRRLEGLFERSPKSILLLGPRRTGKSTLVAALSSDLVLDLAHEPTYLDFARNPHELEERLAPLGRRLDRPLEARRRPAGPAAVRGAVLLFGKAHRPLVWYLGDARRRIEGIDVLPWQEGLRAIGL